MTELTPSDFELDQIYNDLHTAGNYQKEGMVTEGKALLDETLSKIGDLFRLPADLLEEALRQKRAAGIEITPDEAEYMKKIGI